MLHSNYFHVNSFVIRSPAVGCVNPFLPNSSVNANLVTNYTTGVVVDFGQTVSYKCSDSSQALHFDHDYDETELQIKCLDDGSWELNAFLEAAFCVSEEGESGRMMAMPSLHFIIIVVSIL